MYLWKTMPQWDEYTVNVVIFAGGGGGGGIRDNYGKTFHGGVNFTILILFPS